MAFTPNITASLEDINKITGMQSTANQIDNFFSAGVAELRTKTGVAGDSSIRTDTQTIYLWRDSGVTDNGYTSIEVPIGSGKGWQLQTAVVTPEMFGAVGDGVADDIDALDRMATVLQKFPFISDPIMIVDIQKKYKVSRTFLLDSNRYVMFRGKGKIIGNFADSVVHVKSGMYGGIQDIIIENESKATGSIGLKIETSYVNNFNGIGVLGGDQGVWHIGNSNFFQQMYIRNSRVGFYTPSGGDNVNNALRECSIERCDETGIEFAFETSGVYGQYTIDNCYLEHNGTQHIKVENNWNIDMRPCYINMAQTDHMMTLSGTNVSNGYEKSNISVARQSVSTGGVSMFNYTGESKIFAPVIERQQSDVVLLNGFVKDASPILKNPEELRIYNLIDLVSDDGLIPNGFEKVGTGAISFSEVPGTEGRNTISIAETTYVKKTILSCLQNQAFRVQCKMKNDAASLTRVEIYKEDMSERIVRISATTQTLDKYVDYFNIETAGNYTILLRNSSTTASIGDICDIKISRVL